MKFCRPCDGSLEATTDLKVRVVGCEAAREFGRVVTEGFGPAECVANPVEQGRSGSGMDFLVNIDVDDLEKAVRFYSNAFGLRVGRRFGAFGAEMLGGPAPIYLLVKKAGTVASDASSQTRAYERHWTPTHLDFVVGDIDSAVEKAVVAGARLEKPVAIHKWGKLALMADPFGHGFCLVQFLGRGYDEIADR